MSNARRSILKIAGVADAARSLALLAFVIAAAACDIGSDDPVTNAERRELRVEARISVGGTPGAVAASADAIWVTKPAENALVRVDPRARRIAATIRLGPATGVATTNDVAVDEHFVWVTDPLNSVVVRIDRTTNAVDARIRLRHPVRIATGFGAAWVTEDDRLIRIDARSRAADEVIRAIKPAGVVIADGSVWVFDKTGFERMVVEGSDRRLYGGSLLRIDPDTSKVVSRVRTDSLGVADLAVGGEYAWLADPARHAVLKIGLAKKKLLGTLKLPFRQSMYVSHVAFGENTVWLVNALGVVAVHPETNAAVGEVRVSRFERYEKGNPDSQPLGEAAIRDASVWVADPSTNAVVEIATRRG